MSVLERDVVLTGRDGGQNTIDFPITRLGNLEDSAEVKEAPAEGRATMEQVNAAIGTAITGAIAEVYYGTQNAEGTV